MRRTVRIISIILVTVSLLGCQLSSLPWSLLPKPAPLATSTGMPATKPAEETIAQIPTTVPATSPAPSETSTTAPEVVETPTLQVEPTFTPTTLPLRMQQRVFEDLWQVVHDEYLYEDFNGLNWDQVYTETRDLIDSGLSNDEFYLAMIEMIDRLGDDHSIFYTPEEAAMEDAEYEGNLNYVGIGIISMAVPERDRATLLLVFPGSPAERAGLMAHDSILEVNEEPILDEDGYLKDIIKGPEGTSVTLLVESPGGKPRRVTIERETISGGVPVPYTILESPGGQRIGYILLVSFADSTIDEAVGNALKAMQAMGKLDGLIIDNRMNEGGADTVLKGTLSYFTSGVVGFFRSRNEERPLIVTPNREGDSGKLPLVVLIGKDTVSYGEVFAGVLQDNGRAYLIGETTEGNVETLWGYDFEDGSRAWIAHETFQPKNQPDVDWEETGIIPDEIASSNWDEVTVETDPVVEIALEWFD